LDRLRITAQEEPTTDYDFGVLSRVEYARFWELYETLSIEDEGATEAEREEFRDGEDTIGVSRAGKKCEPVY
jgi:hypothetical protein